MSDTHTTQTETVDLDACGPEFTENPYPLYAALRERGPVHRVRSEGMEMWLITGAEEARAALADPRFGKDWRRLDLWHGEPAGSSPIFTNLLEMDPPQHTRLRKLVAREFTGRRVEGLRPRVEAMAHDLLDAMLAAPDGRADLVDAFAFPLPMTVICELLGVPEPARAAFRVWTAEMVEPSGPEADKAAVTGITQALADLVAAKRGAPGDDLLSALVRTHDEDGDRLSGDELLGMAWLLIIAGHETTVNLITTAVRQLLLHPGQLAAVRADFGLLDNVVEEVLRHDGPVENATFRYTTEPVTVAGTTIPEGRIVLVGLASADRDPGRWPEADRFDIHRDTRGHLAFGHGIHYCLGAPLARLEARIALRALLERCPRLALDADPRELHWIRGTLIRGTRTLPVRFRP
ncbi:cytochrome P450 [Streptomyces gamaensis]|uniref:Cytochrome P450 n=1 Tax=Streptomyces gamaensis TaxID=1763542 RepID=A0ABW0YUP4_9ACTN